MKFRQLIYSLFSLVLLNSCSPKSEIRSNTEIPLVELKKSFISPPDSVRPGVYWYFMDGNLSREAMTADLESMKEAGIGNLVFLEVNVGIPRGKVDFLSDEWLDLFKHAEKEAERLGINITLGLGPGWTGSGGPWVKPEQSMQHLVSTTEEVAGPGKRMIKLPKPDPKKPFFGEGAFTEELKVKWKDFYEDVAVLAFPTPVSKYVIEDIDEKALYYRAPYSSVVGVKQFLPAPSSFKDVPKNSSIDKSKIIDLTGFLKPDGTLEWEVPAGKWTIMRFGRTNNGAVTRPAPIPGVGFECDKFDTVAFNAHFARFVEKLIPENAGSKDKKGGLTTLHMDSWEMGAQNWTSNFRSEFQSRRGYDPLPYFPVYAGNVVGSVELSERFLWDLRLTSQELIIQNHVEHVKKVARRYGLNLSVEPYDMNPTADLDLGAVADVPMCEFWNKGIGFNTSFSCIEATSIAHVLGRPVVSSEAFTSDWKKEGYISYPGNVKNQGDWAFCTGINRFVFHTFAHKPYGDQLRPGMTMGGYGVHWDRGQTWWPMASAFHKYVSRCSFLLQQGRTVADILYLTPEGAPHVFRAPASAMVGNDTIPDRRGYNFDGCSPNMLIDNASVIDNKIVFKSGATYKLLVLPAFETMTPELLTKIETLVKDGAVVVGTPPLKSPSLVNYPDCDSIVHIKARNMWGCLDVPTTISEISFGKGKIYWGGELSEHADNELYPHYDTKAKLLKQMGVAEDFASDSSLRYTHRKTEQLDIYFVSNKSDQIFTAKCLLNIAEGVPELWDPVTGETCQLSEFSRENGKTVIPLKFDAYQSFFIVFDSLGIAVSQKLSDLKNFPEMAVIKDIDGAWDVSFDPKWGGPEKVTFEKLEDWTTRPEKGINFYSGIATYSKSFEITESTQSRLFLNLGEVHCMARVRVNGREVGTVWTAPWQTEITDAVKEGKNQLEIEVVNLWANRLIGDEQFPDDGIKDRKWPDWLLEGKPRSSGRFTFCTFKFYDANSPLQKSGLIGPVKILGVNRK
jgi:hypothetical protein